MNTVTIWLDAKGLWDSEKQFICEYEISPADPSVGYFSDDYEVTEMIDSDSRDYWPVLNQEMRTAVTNLVIEAHEERKRDADTERRLCA